MKLFVGNLSEGTDVNDLISLFSEYGNVSYVKIIKDASNQISRGFGFVEMPRKVDAKRAIKTLNEFEFNGNKLIVNEAKSNQDRKNAGSKKNYGRRR